MKNPNGYGCIKHLSGSRRHPWAFVVSEHGKQKVYNGPRNLDHEFYI